MEENVMSICLNSSTLNQIRESLNKKVDQNALDDFRYGISKTSSEDDEEKINAKIAKIRSKLLAGKKLSHREMEFLMKYAPELYRKAVQMQQLRESLKSRLESCDSKEEASKIISSAIGGVSKNDPDYEMKVNTITQTAKEFTKSENYNKLPNTAQDAENIKKSGKINKFGKDKISKNANGSDIVDEENEKVLYEVNSMGYQETYKDNNKR